MTLGLNSDQVVAVCAVLGVCGGVVAWLLKNKDAAQGAQMAAQGEAIAEKFRQSDAYQRDLKSNLDTAWRKIDDLRDERARLWTRVEQKEFETKIEANTKDLRSEIRNDLESLGTRLSADLANLGNRLDNSIRELMGQK